ncbi:hypothetical protein EDF62_3336 [Leucobacter luti]|uniref:DUF7007 domain-containing protein n=1 Tax=Leucobacter luti TaxID=340320 RepID=A0A4R6RRX3_9MICO|nr:hypothetical protein [Leucobacter luti]TDP89583.1 hypothetical protein EDF62_3336 [Leucobacter luti]
MSTSRRKDQGLGATANGGSGGSFASHERSTATPPPAVEHQNWGDTGIHVDSRTPWGNADHVTQPAPGISIVSTAGHGGVKLSRERNAKIPPALRQKNGWYEEDCESHAPFYYFADEMAHEFSHNDPEYMREVAERGLREWYPDEFEKATGQKVSPEQSGVLRERLADQQAFNEFAVVSARGSEAFPDKVVISGHRKSDGDEAEFLVDRDEYRAHDKSQGHFVADQDRHPQLPLKEVEEKPKNKPVAIPDRIPDSVTGAARQRINKDLDQLWRDREGNVRSLHQILERDGASHRSVYAEGEGANIKFRYAIVQDDHSSYRVSKATFDYLDSIPDERTPADLQREDSLRKEAKVRKLEAEHGGLHGRNFVEAHRAVAPARKALLESQEKYLALRKEEEEKRKVREGSHEDRLKAQREKQADRERRARIGGF